MKEPTWKLMKEDNLKTFINCTKCKKLKHKRNFAPKEKYQCKLCTKIYLHGAEKLCKCCNKTKKITSFGHRKVYCKPCVANTHKRTLMSAQKTRDDLADGYVIGKIIQISGLSKEQITPDMVEGYRAKLMLNRILYPKWGKPKKYKV